MIFEPESLREIVGSFYFALTRKNLLALWSKDHEQRRILCEKTNTDRLDFLKETYVLSEPHGIENWLPCTKEVIPLHELDEKDFTFGETASKLSSLQAANFGTAGKAWNAIQSTIGYLNTK